MAPSLLLRLQRRKKLWNTERRFREQVFFFFSTSFDLQKNKTVSASATVLLRNIHILNFHCASISDYYSTPTTVSCRSPRLSSGCPQPSQLLLSCSSSASVPVTLKVLNSSSCLAVALPHTCLADLVPSQMGHIDTTSL